MEDFIINPSLSEFEELSEVNPAQLAIGSGSVVAQPQTCNQIIVHLLWFRTRYRMVSNIGTIP